MIEAYTDGKGDEVTLQQLTQDRARELSDRFQAAGVEAARLQANGMGAANPVARTPQLRAGPAIAARRSHSRQQLRAAPRTSSNQQQQSARKQWPSAGAVGSLPTAPAYRRLIMEVRVVCGDIVFCCLMLNLTAYCSCLLPTDHVPTRSPTTCRLLNWRSVARLAGHSTFFAPAQADHGRTITISAGADDGWLAWQQPDYHPAWPVWFQL